MKVKKTKQKGPVECLIFLIVVPSLDSLQSKSPPCSSGDRSGRRRLSRLVFGIWNQVLGSVFCILEIVFGI